MCNLSHPSNLLVILDLKISTETKIETLLCFFFFSFICSIDLKEKYIFRSIIFLWNRKYEHKIDSIDRVFL